jgi:hypothetical protein
MKTVYTPAFKAQVVLELLKEEKSLSQLANEYKIHPNVLREWRTAAVSNLASLFERGDAPGRCAQARAGPSGGRRYAHLPMVAPAGPGSGLVRLACLHRLRIARVRSALSSVLRSGKEEPARITARSGILTRYCWRTLYERPSLIEPISPYRVIAHFCGDWLWRLRSLAEDARNTIFRHPASQKAERGAESRFASSILTNWAIISARCDPSRTDVVWQDVTVRPCSHDLRYALLVV